MRQITPQLLASIKAGKIASLVKITLNDGSFLGYTDFDMPINMGAGDIIYQPAPGLTKMNMLLTNNAEVSNQEFASAWLDVPDEDLQAGKFDDAIVEVSWVNWENPTANGKLVTFVGTLGSIQWTADGFKADVQSQMRELGKNIGTTVTAGCRHQLFSQPSPKTAGACRLAAGSFTFTGTVSEVVVAKKRIKAAGLAGAENYYANGVIKFTTGRNAGLSVEVKSYEGGVLDLFLPTAFIIAVGDGFIITAGCDKTIETCKARFNNVVNFGGFPHIKPEQNFQ